MKIAIGRIERDLCFDTIFDSRQRYLLSAPFRKRKGKVYKEEERKKGIARREEIKEIFFLKILANFIEKNVEK